MTRVKWVGIFCFLLLPSVTEAAVSISEVAWMGSAASANYEWIELYNDGAAIDVSGWELTDGMNLTITLEGVLPSGYAVLERTSDESAPGTAWHIYTGALVNTGATLRLRDAAGGIVDQVAGGENWEGIGGDNVTKETAQYTEKGWVTAPATPGAPVPIQTATVTTDTTAVTTQSSTKPKPRTTQSAETVRLLLPDVTLQVTVDAQTVGYVHQAIDFVASASDIGDTLIDSLTYEWNFGDGFIGQGEEVTHAFLYPGTYVVTVYASYKRQAQVARHEITILPVTVSLTTNHAGDVQLHNESPYEIDVSGYQLKGTTSFVFPARSVILPNQTVTIPKSKLGNTDVSEVVLYDGVSSLLARYEQRTTVVPEVQVATVQTAPPPVPQVSSISFHPLEEASTVDTAPVAPARFSFATTASSSEPLMSAMVTTTPPVSQLAGAAAAAPATDRSYLYLALLLLAVIAGLYLAPARNN